MVVHARSSSTRATFPTPHIVTLSNKWIYRVDTLWFIVPSRGFRFRNMTWVAKTWAYDTRTSLLTLFNSSYFLLCECLKQLRCCVSPVLLSQLIWYHILFIIHWCGGERWTNHKINKIKIYIMFCISCVLTIIVLFVLSDLLPQSPKLPCTMEDQSLKWHGQRRNRSDEPTRSSRAVVRSVL